MDLVGFAAVITALGLLVGAVAAAYVTVRTSRSVKSIEAKVTQIDHAVNGKPSGAVPMVQQVEELHNETFPDKATAEPDAVLPLLRRVAADVATLKENP